VIHIITPKMHDYLLIVSLKLSTPYLVSINSSHLLGYGVIWSLILLFVTLTSWLFQLSKLHRMVMRSKPHHTWRKKCIGYLLERKTVERNSGEMVLWDLLGCYPENTLCMSVLRR